MMRMFILGGVAALALSACGEREVEEAEVVGEERETVLAQDPLVAPERELDEGVVAGEGGVVGEREIEE